MEHKEIQYQLVEKLIQLGWHISLAESCTGGKACGKIVDVADASKVLNASLVTYANEAKETYLGVKRETLETYGAVSEETAYEMCRGIAERNGAELGIGITGLAGPGGGTAEKPVGMVCFGFCIQGHIYTETRQFGPIGRNAVREAAAEYALQRAYELISDIHIVA